MPVDRNQCRAEGEVIYATEALQELELTSGLLNHYIDSFIFVDKGLCIIQILEDWPESPNTSYVPFKNSNSNNIKQGLVALQTKMPTLKVTLEAVFTASPSFALKSRINVLPMTLGDVQGTMF